jgi:hypothetical protein
MSNSIRERECNDGLPRQEIVVIGKMNLFYKPAPGVCYRHFSIEQTKEALAHIL